MTTAELKSTRGKLGMNQAQMAKALKTPYRTYVNWERGDRPIPGIMEIAIELMLWKDNVVMRAITESIALRSGGSREETVA